MLRVTPPPDPFVRTVELCASIESLLGAGWSASESIGKRFRLSSPQGAGVPALPGSLVEAFESLGELGVSVVLDADFDGMSLRVKSAPPGIAERFMVSEVSAGNPTEAFPDDLREAAEKAWDENVDEALSLPGAWSAAITVDPTALLDRVPGGTEWRAFRDCGAVDRFLASGSWAETSRLVGSPPVGVVLWTGETVRVTTDALAVATLPDRPDVPAPVRWVGDDDVPGVPDPSALRPRNAGPGDASSGLALTLWRLAAAAAWARMASGVTASKDGADPVLEFFGFRRTAHPIPANGDGLSGQACRDAYDLWAWATSDVSPDRLLAVRQVVSLYHDQSPWDRARDVRDSAQPVFLALRGDAVAEAFAQQRAARTFALDVARQSATAAAALARGAVERCLASLAAVGGVVVAESGVGLGDGLAESLRALVAVFLAVLAVWSVVVEGPPVTAPTVKLKDDLNSVAPLLSPDERTSISELASVKVAKRHAWTARGAVPFAYLAAAGAAKFLQVG